MNSNPILDALNAIHRHWLISVCVVAVGSILTVWTVRTLPNVYRSTTLIMVEPQDVPQDFVKATVTTRVEQRLNALSQEVLSRTRLEAIIQDLDLFHEMRSLGVPREQVVEVMRRRIQIQVFPSDNAFRISYEGNAPVVVQQVTARLAGLYIDENLRIRDEHVAGTTEFLEKELDKAKKQLEDQEAQIEAFKQKYMGELPEQQESNMRSLEGMRLQLQTISMALSSAMERKVLLEKEAAALRSAPKAGGTTQRAAPEDPRQRLRQLEADLDNLRAHYTDRHPDVISTKSEIERRRAALGSAPADRVDDTMPLSPELARALTELQLDITRLQTQRQNAEKAIQVYQLRVEASFGRQQQLLALTRDYEVTKKQYQSLLDKKLEAQLAQSLERRQKGERFRVLDPASLPEAPTRPDRRFLMMAGIGGSVALALGLPILLWQVDTSFHVADELAACSVPVLAVIPRVSSRDVVGRRRRYRFRVVGLSVAGLIVGLGTASFYARYLF